ncbi:hypothetical protein HN680_07500, partial [Candidatus Peregrinibacteria bacterium]|nr:hypothetical protein [Candidatus Peregrinibacteria bacterium]
RASVNNTHKLLLDASRIGYILHNDIQMARTITNPAAIAETSNISTNCTPTAANRCPSFSDGINDFYYTVSNGQLIRHSNHPDEIANSPQNLLHSWGGGKINLKSITVTIPSPLSSHFLYMNSS